MIREFDEIYDEYMRKNEGYLSEILTGRKLAKQIIKLLYISIVVVRNIYLCNILFE